MKTNIFAIVIMLLSLGFAKESSNLNQELVGHENKGDVAKALHYSSYKALMDNFEKVGVKKGIDIIATLDKTKQAETFKMIRARMQNEITIIAKDVSQKRGGNVLIVGHGISILALVSAFDDTVNLGKPLANASVTKILYKNGQFKVLSVGEMSYVDQGAKEK